MAVSCPFYLLFKYLVVVPGLSVELTRVDSMFPGHPIKKQISLDKIVAFNYLSSF
jgi:hypothetical protein